MPDLSHINPSRCEPCMAVLAHSCGPRRTPCTGTRAREVANGGLHHQYSRYT